MRALVLLASILVAVLYGSSAAPLTIPERLVFDVSWKGIRAGSAEQTVTARGSRIAIVNTFRSASWISAFFPIEDRLESVISAEGPGAGQPVLYRENKREGRYRAQREGRFDFSRYTVDSIDLLKNTRTTEAIPARTFDSLSSIHFVRSQELVTGQSIFFHIYDFKHLWDAEVRVVRREEIATPLGSFRTLVVTSQLSRDGVPARVGNATFWLTDDSRHIPVRIKTRLKVGEITLDLTAGSYWP